MQTKIYELESPHFMQCQWDFSIMYIFAALFVCPVVTSDRTHTGIRRTVSLHSEHVYKDTFRVETSVKMNYCAILRYTTNTGHHRNTHLS